MIFDSLNKYRDLGLLVLRVGIGIMFMYHGGAKLLAGPDMWTKVGSAMGNLDITFFPVFWGFIASCAEFFGGVLLIIGFLFRPASIILTFDMFVATLFHFKHGDGLGIASHAIECGIVFLSLILIGAGAYSLDAKLAARKAALNSHAK